MGNPRRFILVIAPIWMTFWLLLMPAASLAAPVRLAVITESPDLSMAADLLTTQLSGQNQIAVLERAQINKVLSEQATAATGGRNDIRIGELLGADGLLVLELSESEGGGRMLLCRLVAVKPGVVLGASEYAFPLPEAEEWSKLVVAKFQTLFSKLDIAKSEAVPVSILNLGSAISTPDSETLDHQLTLLLHSRLMTEKNFFVLERRRLQLLADEKQWNATTNNPFWTGGYLIDGVINPQGLASNFVTINIQLTPPDKRNIVSLKASGSSADLPKLIDDLSRQIIAAAKMSTPGAAWESSAEAERYFSEAKWMFKWKMFREAKDAVESAWALGRQDRETADLRIKAYAAAAGSPGSSMVVHQHVFFGSSTQEKIHNSSDIAAFASTPLETGFADMTRAAEYLLDAQHRFRDATSKPDYTGLNFEAKFLEQYSTWLRYFYFNMEARTGHEDDIAQARQLCREIAGINQDFGSRNTNFAILAMNARNFSFFAASPEQASRQYRAWVDAGQWAHFRARFFNDSYRQFGSRHFSSMRMDDSTGQDSTNADLANPCLAGWDAATRARCPELWRKFIDELCGSTQPQTQLEGRILRCSWSWSESDFQDNLKQALDYLLQNPAPDWTNDHELLEDLNRLVKSFRATASPDAQQRIDAIYSDFKTRHVSAAKLQVQKAADSARKIDMERKIEFLRTQTNFDFMAFSRNFLLDQFTPDEARQLSPLVPEYLARIRRNTDSLTNRSERSKAEGSYLQAQLHVSGLEKTLQNAASAPPPATAATPATTAAVAPTHVPPPIQRSVHSVAGQTSPVTVSDRRFWPLPGLPAPGQPPDFRNAPHILSCCYRNGKLWLEVGHGFTLTNGQIEFISVNLQNFSSETIEFEGQQFATINSGMTPSRAFDVAGDYLYFNSGGGVKRYSFQQRAWQPFSLVGNTIPERVGTRLFFTSPTSLLERQADDSVQVIASARRRPAVTPLDNLDNYGVCHPFAGASGGVEICVGKDIYILGSNATDLHLAGSFPASIVGEQAELSDDGLIALGGSAFGWWGMSRASATPECWFAQFTSGGQIAKSLQSPPRWTGSAPGKEVCLDDDKLWFLTGREARPMPLIGHAGLNIGGQSLTCFKFGQASPVTIPMRLSEAASQGRAISLNRPGRQWLLQPVPEGLVITSGTTPGFWLLDKTDLQRALAAAGIN